MYKSRMKWIFNACHRCGGSMCMDNAIAEDFYMEDLYICIACGGNEEREKVLVRMRGDMNVSIR